MNNKKYPSKYSNGKQVSAAQYITEIICEKMAQRKKKDLHYRFWISPQWSKFYRNQIASAHKLLKQYPDNAIVKALNNPKADRIYSLRAPHLPAIIEYEVKQLDAKNDILSIELTRNTGVNFKQNRLRSNILSKLRELEDES